jgi:serine/threonine protein kinase
MSMDTSNSVPKVVGKYDVLEKLAEGGMGTVYKGRNRETGEMVAIKIVAQHMIGNEVLLKRFEQEYTAARQLDHPNIVKALDYGDIGAKPYLVMEFVQGMSLGQKIDQDGKMPEKEAIRLIAQVAQGLHRAHKANLIHRDVKPDNIMVTTDGQAKLTDLGLVKETLSDLNLTRTGRGLGTPHFMAPEQFKNAKNVDARCDIYSLGATLYMMVTGEMPFRASGPLDAYMKKLENKIVAPRTLAPELSERIDWAILRAMNPDPDQRPSTCREFVEDLTGRSTRKPTVSATSDGSHDVWYLVYKDEEGVSHTVKGSTPAIRRSLKEGLLGDASNIRASRTKDTGFDTLKSFPEFRDLIVAAGSGLVAIGDSSKSGERSKPSNKAPATPNLDPTVVAKTPAVKSPTPRGKRESKKRRRWPVWLQWLLLAVVIVASVLAGWKLLPH